MTNHDGDEAGLISGLSGCGSYGSQGPRHGSLRWGQSMSRNDTRVSFGGEVTAKSFDIGSNKSFNKSFSNSIGGDRLSRSRMASMIFGDDAAEDGDEAGSAVGEYFGTQKMDITEESQKLGTLRGVMFPCLANIFGVILFLRQPWIVGEAGVFVAEAVVLVSVLCTTLTALSMSAIATNGQVKAGGTYFMISRTLGPEFGGAVGLSFYLATAIAIPMYLLGTVETMKEGFDIKIEALGAWDSQVIGFSLSLLCMLCVFVGVQYVSKAIPFFLSVTVLGIVSMWLGLITGWHADVTEGCRLEDRCISSMWSYNQLKDNLDPVFTKEYDWRYMFGLFFPSVTGITAGANLSACLKSPSKSIPSGTLGAISISTVVYVVNILLFAMSLGGARLRDLSTVTSSDIAFPHPVVVKVAIVSSTLGAALTSFAGAPRLLQALAYDGTLPLLNFLREDPEKEPRKTLYATWLLAVSGIMVGKLNSITPICTMFFLTFYGFTNLACMLLSILRSPNYRPDFTTANAYTSGLGALMCVALMFIINPIVACGSLLFCSMVYMYIAFAGQSPDWGDALFDLRWYTTRKSLLRLDKYGPVHCKNWRPNLLLLTKVALNNGEPDLLEEDLCTFLSHLRHARGMQVLGTVLEHDLDGPLPPFDLVEARESITNLCHQRRMKCFVQVVADSVPRGVESLLQVAGVGRFQPNIVVSGWPQGYASSKPARDVFISTLRMCELLHKALIVLRSAPNELPDPDDSEPGTAPPPSCYPAAPAPGSTIDIWWTPHGGGLLLLIPHLLGLHRNWSATRLRCFSVVPEGSDVEEVEESVKELFRQLRLQCECHVLEFAGSVKTFVYPRLSVRDVLAAASEQMKTKGNEAQLEKASRMETYAIAQTNANAAVAEGAFDASAPSEAAEVMEGAGGSLQKNVVSEDWQDHDAAVRLNKHIKEESSGAAVVIMNLPKINIRAYKTRPDDNVATEYMAAIDALTAGLPPTLLIRDGGRDVTTSFS